MMVYPFLSSDTPVTSSQELVTIETEIETEIEAVALAVNNDKPNFAAISEVTEKKQAFIDYLRVSVEVENNRILAERELLDETKIALENKSIITTEQEANLARLGNSYNWPIPSTGIDNAWLEEMLHRVNVIPEALILTQAANESAWGTSRFAVQANNYFGQWCYSKGCGLVPEQRPEGATHEVAKFDTAQQSVNAYFMNINRNAAYAELRNIRAKLMLNRSDLTSTDAALALSQGLQSYSERGQAYIDELQAMIRFNQTFWLT
ncbi:glucosaminidase domain-containing protein [Vibrio ulleungensis]|uniref:Glucosaminidase domain-containing protein n=1 Tax=Vibrio ulleungensis TaxID=2807619 RepID=A0ABS2HDD9_9VIBR|nr:glucosaminidase domain-containing protein [Vibrio ulleungensis]MBM7035600.1 glucosaminidase domain-containing protein [Vibrio ulleungensis]